MTKERFIQTIKVNLLRGEKRIRFMKSTFAGYGEKVSYFPKIMPLYPELIRFGNNIVVANGVSFITHDAIHAVLNGLPENSGGGYRFKEKVGCIEIGDNVFIGAKSTIMYNIRIGSNVIIGAGSLVIMDCEDGGVYVGTPVRKIGSFENYIEKRKQVEPEQGVTRSQHLTLEEANYFWNEFEKLKR